MLSSPSERIRAPGPLPPWLSALQAVGPESALPEVWAAVEGLLAEDHWLSRLTNVTAVLRRHMPDLFSASIYLTGHPGSHLWLGPSQGPPLPSRIGWGEGVVGSAALERAVQIIAETRRFHGYRPPYPEMVSEIALPLVRNRIVMGVLEASAPVAGRFAVVEAELLQGVAERLERAWPEAWWTGIPF